MSAKADKQPAEAELLTIEQVAKLLQVSTRTVYRMSQDGEIPSPIKLGPRLCRWRRSVLQQWFENNCEGV